MEKQKELKEIIVSEVVRDVTLDNERDYGWDIEYKIDTRISHTVYGPKTDYLLIGLFCKTAKIYTTKDASQIVGIRAGIPTTGYHIAIGKAYIDEDGRITLGAGSTVITATRDRYDGGVYYIDEIAEGGQIPRRIRWLVENLLAKDPSVLQEHFDEVKKETV